MLWQLIGGQQLTRGRINSDPKDQQADHHKDMGNQYLQIGCIDEAIMHYTKSIVSLPHS